MAVNNFIPQVWSSQILQNLHKAQVWGNPAVANTNYQGDISQVGNTVRIGAIGAVTVRKFAPNTDIALPDTLTDASSVLSIDQGDYFNFQIDDVNQAQANVDLMETAMYEAGYAISNAADFFIATTAIQNVSPSNLVGAGTDASPNTITVSSGFSSAYDYLVQAHVKLLEANVPDQDLWAIVAPFYRGALLRDDRFVNFGTTAQTERLENGLIGMVDGFNVYVSNNVPITNTSGVITNSALTAGGQTTGAYNITVGSNMAISYADQVTEMVAYRPEKRFSDAVKGLHIYGAKVVRPQALAVIKVAYFNS